MHKGAALRASCRSGFELAGNSLTFCDGRIWDRPLGYCRETHKESEIFCDFEAPKLCGWINDATHYIDWTWKNSAGRNVGPTTDHTYKKALQGYFLIIQGRGDHEKLSARLISPVYKEETSNKTCFQFYYHMTGRISGTIRVYIKPVSLEIENIINNELYLIKTIEKTSSILWREALMKIPKQNEDFQIIIEGELAIKQVTDIAIDDVAILSEDECTIDELFTTQKPIDEDIDLSDLQTCQNRCNDSISTTISTTNSYQVCDCFKGCIDYGTCCQDYEIVCVFDSG